MHRIQWVLFVILASGLYITWFPAHDSIFRFRFHVKNFHVLNKQTFSRTVGHLSNQTLCVTSDLSAEDPCSSGSSLNFSLSSQHIFQLVVYNDGEPAIVMVSLTEGTT